MMIRSVRGAALVASMLAAAAASSLAQQLPQARLDSLFSRYTSSTPGCAVAIASPGVRLERAYGMADLEHGAPNLTATIFEAGSVSKQFTAAAVVLLAQQGKLSLDDDVRKYIPEVPDFGGKRITIRQLLNHASGLRDWGVIAGVQGWPRGTRAYGNAHVLDIVAHQQALNFPPGDEWMYSNTNYNLAAILVQRVSGKSLADYTREAFFVPLGMTHTSWRDDYRRVVPGRAVAYAPGRQGFRAAMPNEDAYGNGGLLTTVGDLLTWNAAELDSGKVGGRALVAELEREGVLRSGKADGYGLGLFLTDFRTIREVSHPGATGGYAALLARWPARQAALALLCNGASTPDLDALKALALGDAAVTQAMKAAPPPPPPPRRVALEPGRLAALAGIYRDRGSMQPIVLTAADSVLKPARGAALLPVSATEFVVADDRDVRVVFAPANSPGRFTALQITRRDTTRLEPVAPFDTTKLADYAGDWYSPEAQATWPLTLQGGRLFLTLGPDMRLPLTPAYQDAFAGPGGSVLVFERDASGKVSALGVWLDRARDMRFEKRR